MSFLNKVQGLSLFKRKLILWGVVIVVSSVLMTIWLKSAKERLGNLPPSSGLEETVIPPMDLPQIPTDFPVPPELQKELDALEKQYNEENKTNQ